MIRMALWGWVMPILVVAALVAFEEWRSSPICETLDSMMQESPDDLKVMMVADLLLLDPADAGYAQLYFRDPFIARFLKKSFQKLKPDMLVVLGDISASGSYLTDSKWLRLLRHFQKMLGPFTGYPLHVVLGDRDIGHCEKMDLQFVNWISKNLPGLDPSGCGSFEIANISFVSLNSVAMLCENSEARYSVEATIERESLDLQAKTNERKGEGPYKVPTASHELFWRENFAAPGSGPVLLLHFPLFLNTRQGCSRAIANLCEIQETKWKLNYRGHDVHPAPYQLAHDLPVNVTEYMLQALRPRIVFSAHSHQFRDHIYGDGTREVTVPSMSWAARDDPSFVIVIFRQNDSDVISQCYLPRESQILMVYSGILFILLATTFAWTRSVIFPKIKVSGG